MTDEQSRVIAIDFGEKRIGVAVSDPLGITAQPVCTIHRKGKKKDIAELLEIISRYEAGQVVMGLPLRADGSAGEIAEKAKKFGEAVRAASGLPVAYQDERFTTVEAEEVLLLADMSRKRRKEVIDKLAAQLILQKYLDKKG